MAQGTRSRRPFSSTRHLPSGRWQASYWWHGERHVAPQTWSSKGDASAWLAGQEDAIRRGAWADPTAGKVTVEDLAQRWLTHDARKRTSTRKRDEAIIRLHVLPALGTKRLSNVTPADIQHLVDTWTTSSPSTVSRQYSTMRAMFSYAVDSDWLARSPCRGVRLPRVELVDRPEVDGEMLSSVARALGAAWEPFVWLGALGGLRWAEVAGLRVCDIDTEHCRVTVVGQIGRDRKLGRPKTQAARRSMSVPPWLAAMLASLVAERDVDGDGEALLFVTRRGTPLDYTRWRARVWVPAVEQAGVPHLRFHDLRSAAATAMVMSGVDVRTAQTRLGHSSPTVTLGIYARMTEAADRAAGAAVDQFFAHASRTNAEPFAHESRTPE